MEDDSNLMYSANDGIKPAELLGIYGQLEIFLHASQTWTTIINNHEKWNSNQHLNIYHPGFPKARHNTLLRFECLDFARVPDTNSFKVGLSSIVAYWASEIITGNFEDTYLTFDSTTGPKVHLSIDSNFLLPPGDYYLHREITSANSVSASPPYAICPSFEEWVYPHGLRVFPTCASIPRTAFPLIKQAPSAMTSSVKNRDGSCRITNSLCAIKNAHILPREEREWFITNRMQIYNRNAMNPDCSDASNGITLRRDIHFLWDQKIFTFVPKNGFLVPHFFFRYPEASMLYHNTKVYNIFDVSPDFIYARFAWSIFQMLVPFLNAEPSIHLALKIKVEDQTAGDESRYFFKYGSGRDILRNTSSKRSRGQQEKNQEDKDISEEGSIQSTSSTNPEEPSQNYLARADDSLAESIFKRAYPNLSKEVSYSEDPDWHSLAYYPGALKVQQMKDAYIKQDKARYYDDKL